MSVFTAILEPSADGTLHLPLPEAWRRLPIRIKAEMEPAAPQAKRTAKPGLWKNLQGTFWIAPDFDAPLEDFKEYME
jgi:hypothetical protein